MGRMYAQAAAADTIAHADCYHVYSASLRASPQTDLIQATAMATAAVAS